MRRTTIMLPVKLKTRAERQARSENVSLAEFIRNSLEQRLSEENKSRGRDPLFADDFVFHDEGPTDVAEHHDKYLDEILEEERARWSRK